MDKNSNQVFEAAKKGFVVWSWVALLGAYVSTSGVIYNQIVLQSKVVIVEHNLQIVFFRKKYADEILEKNVPLAPRCKAFVSNLPSDRGICKSCFLCSHFLSGNNALHRICTKCSSYLSNLQIGFFQKVYKVNIKMD